MRRRALEQAAAMGRRAGTLFRDYGIPSRCPFRRDDLARAWASGYAEGLES